MNADERRTQIKQFSLMAAGLLSLCATRFGNSGILYSVSTFAWLLIFLYLTLNLTSGKMLLLTGVTFSVGIVIHYWGVLGSPLLDIPLLLLFGATTYGLLLLNRVIVHGRDCFWLTLISPLIWMTAYIIVTWLRVPSLMRIDMMFFDATVILQCESLVGALGLSFLVHWTVALIVHALSHTRVLSWVVSGSIVTAVFLFGLIRLLCAPDPTAYVKAAYATGPYVGDFINFWEIDHATYYDSFDRAAETAAEGGANVLIFNEETYAILDTEEDPLLAHISAKAAELHLHVLVGLDISDSDGSDDHQAINKVVWIDDHGQILGEYVKRQIIPVLEDGYVRGDGKIPSFKIRIGDEEVTTSFAICYDSNFPLYFRQIPRDTQLLFLPSWDWKGVTPIHYRLCGSIAVENRVTLLKPTYDGYSVALDPYGRTVKLTSTDKTGFESVQFVSLPIY